MTTEPPPPRGSGTPDSVADLRFATGLPPGWIELGAFDDEDTARSFLAVQLAGDGDAFDAEQRRLVVDTCVSGYRLLRDQEWLHVGALVTYVPTDLRDQLAPEAHRRANLADSGEWQTTVWTVAVGVMSVPSFPGVNPLGAVQRLVGRFGYVDSHDSFTMADGREGVVLGGTVAIDPEALGLAPGQLLPQLEPHALGVYVCLLPLDGVPDHQVVGIGIAPNVAERAAMSLVASQMAASLTVVDDLGAYDRERVLVDTTRRVWASGHHPGAGHPPHPAQEAGA